MSESIAATFRDSYEKIAKRLDAVRSPEEREQVKGEIVGLFKTVDQAINDLDAVKEDIRVLVDRYKSLVEQETGDRAPQFTGAAPVLHADHIGGVDEVREAFPDLPVYLAKEEWSALRRRYHRSSDRTHKRRKWPASGLPAGSRKRSRSFSPRFG